ncbi:hypothetical protein EAH68_03015 [Corynebacterium hylobatis]|uniref:Uncharacterized protein n=1 Tax=Corynebacterium hylobatis TaxID=1859290 RepID=A0A3S0HIM8_9CORY|nr:hypothetical protein [Corynebacterium hylobatis]RSZ65127.1 hypothetical protein EAH68_03015 [Corynebacterium hylobatis]
MRNPFWGPWGTETSPIWEIGDFVTFGKNIGAAITGFPNFVTNTVGFSSNYPGLAAETAQAWDSVVATTSSLFG